MKMSPKTNKWTRNVTKLFSSSRVKKTDTIPSETSASGPVRAVGDVDAHDGDGDPDNESTLSAGTYTITNVGRKRRAALCSPDEKEGVVASLDGTNVIPEAGDEVSTQV
jgi:hypothetical protein